MRVYGQLDMVASVVELHEICGALLRDPYLGCIYIWTTCWVNRRQGCISKSEDLCVAVSNVIHCSLFLFAFIDMPLPFYISL